jgi:hypothetical protein
MATYTGIIASDMFVFGIVAFAVVLIATLGSGAI